LVNGQCVDCPEGGVCGGNEVLGNQAGFWNSGKNDKFYPCYRSSNPSKDDLKAAEEACPRYEAELGDERQPTQCGNGYQGPACLQCETGGDTHYGTSGPFCRKCPPKGINYFVVAICALVILSILIFLVIQGRTAKNKESVSTKILLNHVQMLALLSTLGAVWTEPFFSVLLVGGVATFVDNRVISTDCAFSASYYEEFIFFMLIPFITLFLAAVVYLIIYLVKVIIIPFWANEDVNRSKLRKDLAAQYILAVTVITFIVYPAICIKVLGMYDCSIDIEGKKYLNTAPEIMCGTAEHTSYVIWASIMLIVFCVGAPLFAFFMLLKYRRLENPHVQMVLRFFSEGFKTNRYYWEIAILAKSCWLLLPSLHSERVCDIKFMQ